MSEEPQGGAAPPPPARRAAGAAGAAATVLLGVLVLALLAVRFHAQQPTRLEPQNLDLYHQYYPNAIYLNAELKQGRLAAWNPYQLAGQPWLAMHYPGALYPPNLLAHRWLSTPRAEEVLIFAHLWLAGVFTWLFARRLGAGPSACLAAAIVYAFSGKMLFGVYAPYALHTHTWLPAMLWSLDILVANRRTDGAVAFAAISSLGFLGGHAQGFLFMATLTGAYGAACWLKLTDAASRVRTLALVALAVALALGLVAPQLLPTWELTTQAVRNFDGQTFEAASRPVAPPSMLAKGLLGTLGVSWFGASAVERGPGWGAAGHLPPLQWGLTVPLLTLPLAGFALARRRQRGHALFFAGAALISGLYALGEATPLFGWIYTWTPFALFRGPIRVDFVYVFSAAILCALGLQAVAEHAPRRALLGVALIALGVATRAELPLAHPAASLEEPSGPPELAAFAREHGGAQRIFLELSQNFEDRSLFAKFGQMHGVFAVPDYEPTAPAIYQRFFGIERALPWLGSVTVRGTRDGLNAPDTVRMLDLMSVRQYVFATTIPENERQRLAEIVGGVRRPLGDRLEVVERRQALPRAYTVARVRGADSHADEIARVRRPSFDPWREAVVENTDEATRLGVALASGPARRPPRLRPATIRGLAPGILELDVDCKKPCWLVLTDLDYPGWIARVDGEERPIRRTNGLFRGVAIEAGEHTVVFRYEASPLRWGLSLSAAAFAVCVVLWAAPLARRRR